MSAAERKRIVIVEDSPAFTKLWTDTLRDKYGDSAAVETYAHPYDALPNINDKIDRLIADLEVPGMDGERLIDTARERGVPAARIIVTSSLPAEELHQRFELGEAIAVISKTEPEQQKVFLMILDAVMRH